jgi:PAS domain S-box-containing protein
MSFRHQASTKRSNHPQVDGITRLRTIEHTLDHLPGADRDRHAAAQRLTRMAARALGVRFAALKVRTDGETVSAIWHAPGPLQAVGSLVLLEEGLCSMVTEHGRLLLVDDLRQAPSVPRNPAVRAWGIRGYLGVPFSRAEAALSGVLCFGETARRVWSSDDLELIEDLLATIGVEMERYLDAEPAAGMVGSRGEAERRTAHPLHEPLFLFGLDSEGRFTYVSSSVEQVLGYRAEEIEGAPCREILPDGLGDPQDHAVADASAPIAQALSIVPALHRDGRTLRVELLTSLTIRNGGVNGIHGLAREISQRTQAEARRVSAEAHYRRLVETSPYGIYAIDAEGRITEMNAAAGEVLGVSGADAVGSPFQQFVAPEYLEGLEAMLADQLSGASDRHEQELEVVRPSGERRLVQLRSTAIRDGDAIVGVHGVGRDITDERARELQFRRAERISSLGTLLSGVAHELNNPLTSIKSYSQLMLLDERSVDDQESLFVIQREADRASRIVSDLRLIAQQSRSMDVERAALDLNQLVRGAIELSRHMIDIDGIELREDLTRDPLPIWGDEQRLQQMVVNLLANAHQAVRAGSGEPRIIVRTRPSRRGLALAVIDSGGGIAPEHLDRIFDPFWTTRDPGEGTGLGLSVVHGIVVEHGGEIRVESEMGRGTAFTVDLPWSSPLGGSPPTVPGGELLQRPLRILLVEDEAPIRLSLARFLERRGHVVDDAEHGGRALTLLEEQPPYDLIVSDLRMPGLDGEALFTKLRARGGAGERRVVFITGDATSPDVDGFLRTCGAPVVLKPFALGELAEMLERHAWLLSQTET